MTTLPLPVRDLFDRIHVPRSEHDAAHLLSDVTAISRVVEEFRPVCESLEWSLGHLHWARAGVAPFVRNEVPFLINNDGLTSESAAAVLFASCRRSSDRAGPVRVLELGAGLGLFARFFLDAFRSLCEQESENFYERLTYIVTDGSAHSVEHWRRVGLFAGHDGRVITGVCDALRPNQIHPLDGSTQPIAGLHAILCNYILDVLPASIVRQGEQGVEELQVRTHLAADAALVAQYTSLSSQEICALAGSANAADRERLIPLLPILEVEVAFRPLSRTVPYLDTALANGSSSSRILVNDGALTCLEQSLGLIEPDGFVLINDYGPVGEAQGEVHAQPQRFGATSAHGLNFPLLEKVLVSRGCRVSKAAGDDERSIHTRLVTLNEPGPVYEVFEARFGKQAAAYFTGPIESARAHIAAGRKGEALEDYKLAVSRQPRNWSLIGEAGEFVALHLLDYQAGLELASAAIELNPCYSSWLWNVLGDCLYCLNRHADAHEAYLQAERIDEHDPRAQLNLAYTYQGRGEFDAALESVAAGLASDLRGAYRDKLLERQQQILANVAARAQGERERLGARQLRFQ
jgi:tetratricopeptide (TPR) repeat protein